MGSLGYRTLRSRETFLGLSKMMSFDENQLAKNKFNDETKAVGKRIKTKLRASSSSKMEISVDLLRSEGREAKSRFLSI